MGRWDKRADMVVHGVEPYNAEPPRRALADQVLTPLAAFYSRNHGPIPHLDAGTWRLRVDGLVERTLSLSLADLQERFAPRTLVATLQCAGNRRAGLIKVRAIPGEDPWGSGATSTAQWTGAALADVLASAGIAPQAQHVSFIGPDVSQLADPAQAYGGSIGVAKGLAGDVILAWSMNGEPLPVAHGAPVRVVVPGYIGARSVKWVQRITAQAEPSDNYFQRVAYRLPAPGSDATALAAGEGLSLGPVALNSDILRPDDGMTVPAGPTQVHGYAFTGDQRGVARVEVSSDGGRTWVDAELDEPLSPWSWRLWSATLDLPAGDVAVTVRAWDTTGATQPASPAQVWNPKGYVNNSCAQVRLNVAD